MGCLDRRRLPARGAADGVLLGIVPLPVYVASYTGRMPGELLALPWVHGSVWRGIWEHQRAMLDFHTALAGDHPYQSPPWSWPLIKRPVAYWFSRRGRRVSRDPRDGQPGRLVAGARWPSLASSSPGGAPAGTSWRPEPVILAAAPSTYLPWLVLSGDRSQTFIWYLLPTIPFLCLALGFFAPGRGS